MNLIKCPVICALNIEYRINVKPCNKNRFCLPHTARLYSYLHVPPAAIQLPVCLKTDPQPLPKPVPRTVRSSGSYFNFRYRLVSLSSSTNCLRLLISLPFPSLLSCLSVTCFRRQILHNVCQIYSAFLLVFFFCIQYVPILPVSLNYLYIFSYDQSNWSSAFFSSPNF